MFSVQSHANSKCFEQNLCHIVIVVAIPMDSYKFKCQGHIYYNLPF